MRSLGMIFASLTMLCLLCAPALAQSAPSTAQYEGGGSGYCPPGSYCAQSLADGADDFSENAGEGADAVNEAMKEPEAAAVADPEASPSTDAAGSVPPEGGPARAEAGGPVGITSLPETGGVSLAALGSGMLLAASGLMVRRIVG